jgi:CopG family nickel-responsive transcriptional regulator
MTAIVRVGVTFPPELLRDLDEAVTRMGYASRSKAIQDSVRAFVTEQKWLEDIRGVKVGSIILIYNHEMRGPEADLTDTQHQFSSIICASMHVHISREKCLETIAIKGSAEEIKRLVEKLRARRGVEEVRLSVFSI